MQQGQRAAAARIEAVAGRNQMGPDIETGTPGAAGGAAADRWLFALGMDNWCPAEGKSQGNHGREAKRGAWVTQAAGLQQGQAVKHWAV